MPKLYQYAACPFCNKVMAMLAIKKVAYETIEVHPLNKKEIAFSPDYQKVPIYIDSEGKQNNDSTEIMRHIEKEFPGNQVFERNEAEIKRENEWLEWSEGYVQGLPTVIYRNFPESYQAFGYITQVGKFSAWEKFMIRISGSLIMSMVGKKIAKRLEIQDPIGFFKKKIADWAQALEGKSFLGGTYPNGADVAVFGISRVVFDLDAGKYFKENTLFYLWLKRMSEATGISLSKRQ